jgi:hypothetical protein
MGKIIIMWSAFKSSIHHRKMCHRPLTWIYKKKQKQNYTTIHVRWWSSSSLFLPFSPGCCFLPISQCLLILLSYMDILARPGCFQYINIHAVNNRMERVKKIRERELKQIVWKMWKEKQSWLIATAQSKRWMTRTWPWKWVQLSLLCTIYFYIFFFRCFRDHWTLLRRVIWRVRAQELK